MKGIGGGQKTTSIVTIQMHSLDLELTFDVEFMVNRKSIPPLLSMTNMITNGLDIYIQQRHMTLKDKVQKLEMQSFFLI